MTCKLLICRCGAGGSACVLRHRQEFFRSLLRMWVDVKDLDIDDPDSLPHPRHVSPVDGDTILPEQKLPDG
jgi:hypothetical protein